MMITKDSTVGDVVSQNIKTADIFKKHGIDFCCGGGISIDKACHKNDTDLGQLIEELNQTSKESLHQSIDYNSWSLDFLIDYIVQVHHNFVQEKTPIVLEYAQKVAKVHGHHYKEVRKIHLLFQEAAEELLLHLKKEEQVLFPYIRQMVQAEKNKQAMPPVHFGSVQNPVRMMENEHENAGSIFKEIAKLSNNYTPPKEACNTFKALYNGLQTFEEDLHQHIHLENNILHKKALQLEKTLLENN